MQKVKMQKKNIVLVIYSLNSGFGDESFLNPIMATATPRNRHRPIAFPGGSILHTPSSARQRLFRQESSV